MVDLPARTQNSQSRPLLTFRRSSQATDAESNGEILEIYHGRDIYIYIYTPEKNGIQYQSISDIPESLNQNHLPDNESGISPLNGEIW